VNERAEPMRHDLIYIAGPYTKGDPVENTRNATAVGKHIYARTGAGVIIPHLSLLAHMAFPEPPDFWYGFDLAILSHCTHLLRLPGESWGADQEVKRAHELGIPVFLDMGKLLVALR
jgi:hypothetical protein